MGARPALSGGLSASHGLVLEGSRPTLQPALLRGKGSVRPCRKGVPQMVLLCAQLRPPSRLVVFVYLKPADQDVRWHVVFFLRLDSERNSSGLETRRRLVVVWVGTCSDFGTGCGQLSAKSSAESEGSLVLNGPSGQRWSLTAKAKATADSGWPRRGFFTSAWSPVTVVWKVTPTAPEEFDVVCSNGKQSYARLAAGDMAERYEDWRNAFVMWSMDGNLIGPPVLWTPSWTCRAPADCCGEGLPSNGIVKAPKD